MKQLTYKDCITIEILLKEGYNAIEISKKLRKNKTSIYREIDKYSVDGVYNGTIARSKRQLKRILSKGGPKRIKEGSELERYVLKKVKEYWSPEQIAGRWYKDTKEKISKDTIYNYIYVRHKELIKEYFRRRGKKYINHRSGKYQIYNRTFIDKRPKEVEERNTIGHWEGDTIVGPGHKGAVITLVERVTGYLLGYQLDNWYADKTSLGIYELMKAIPTIKKKTLTVDNGREFSDHMVIRGITGMEVYFAYPYKSRLRATNENTNGLLRQFIPKKRNIRELSQGELDKYVKLINNRPRKRLGYYTPEEIFN